MRTMYLGACTLVVALVWLIVVIGLQGLRQRTIDEASANHRALAQILVDHVGAQIRAIDLAALRLRDVWRDNPTQFEAEVERQKALLASQSILQVAVTDASGWVVWNSTTGPLRPGEVSLSDREHFQIHQRRPADDLFVGVPVLGRTSHQWTIQFTRAIRDDKGRLRYVMTLSVPPPALERVYDTIARRDDVHISLVRSDGHFLARSGNFDHAEAPVLEPATTPGLGSAGPDAGESRRTTLVDRRDSIVTFQRVPGYPLTVFVSWDLASGLRSFSRQRDIVLVLALLLSVVLFMFTRMLIVRRVARMRDERARAQQAERDERAARQRLTSGEMAALFPDGVDGITRADRER
jgi:hypothetical protein